MAAEDSLLAAVTCLTTCERSQMRVKLKARNPPSAVTSLALLLLYYCTLYIPTFALLPCPRPVKDASSTVQYNTTKNLPVPPLTTHPNPQLLTRGAPRYPHSSAIFLRLALIVHDITTFAVSFLYTLSVTICLRFDRPHDVTPTWVPII